MAAISPPTSPIILYDGDCNMCNATVQWVLKRDKAGTFRFAALTSQAANQALTQAGVKRESLPDSMVVIDAAGVHTQSDAVIKITSTLGGMWSIFSAGRIVPRSWRNAIYALIAKHRKNIMGTSAHCLVPTPEVQARFLDRNERSASAVSE
ncbi:MAG: DCC1-like thiol-disulfide oxidoreductase family protein [Phycisphaerales bacterium]